MNIDSADVIYKYISDEYVFLRREEDFPCWDVVFVSTKDARKTATFQYNQRRFVISFEVDGQFSRAQPEGPAYIYIHDDIQKSTTKGSSFLHVFEYRLLGKLHRTIDDGPACRREHLYANGLYVLNAQWAKNGKVNQEITLSIDDVNCR